MKVFSHVLLLLFLFTTSTIAQDEKPQAIERACPSVFKVNKAGKIYSLRYASNHPIAEKNSKIKQLVIYIHGARRNGLDYYEWGEKAVKTAENTNETLFISPQFTSEKDLENHGHDSSHLFWTNNNWRIGDESVSSKKRKMADSFSSFTVLDSMISNICNKNIFPELKKVIVVGHSAGGQFVSRYLGTTNLPNILKKYKFSFIVMNPSSYLYLDDRRPFIANSVLSFKRPDTTGCPNFNVYPRGMEKLNPYAAKVDIEKIKRQFLTREVVFLLGGNDVNMNDSSLDKSCEGNLQGRFRLERGQFFYEYLQLYAKKKKIHKMEVVPGVAHDGDRMINSKAALRYLYKI
jgi:hypothetical protein